MIDQMLAGGMTPEQVLIAVKVMLATRSNDAIRQARRRERIVTERDNHGQSVTVRDNRDSNPSPLTPLDKSLSPVPPIEIKPPYTPQLQERAFEEFWIAYPNKVGKADARKSFSKAASRIDQGTLMAGLQRYVAKTDDRPWCNPATWLNQDRWGDQPQAVARGDPRPPKLADRFKAFGDFLDERQDEIGNGGAQQAVQYLPSVTGK